MADIEKRKRTILHLKESYLYVLQILEKDQQPSKNIFDVMPKFSFDINCRPEELEIHNYFEILSKYEDQI